MEKNRVLKQSLTHVYSIMLCVVLHAFSVLCMYSKFGHPPHPVGYLLPNFISFAASTAELAHAEKSRTQSITQSAYLMPREPKRLRFGKFFPKRLRIFNQNFTRLLHVHIYAKLQHFIQLPPTLTKLSHIKHNHPVNFYTV